MATLLTSTILAQTFMSVKGVILFHVRNGVPVIPDEPVIFLRVSLLCFDVFRSKLLDITESAVLVHNFLRLLLAQPAHTLLYSERAVRLIQEEERTAFGRARSLVDSFIVGYVWAAQATSTPKHCMARYGKASFGAGPALAPSVLVRLALTHWPLFRQATELQRIPLC